jgi:putative transposase
LAIAGRPIFEKDNSMSTFSRIYIQIVFSVRNRELLIDPLWEERLFQYITGIIQNKGQKLIAIGGMPDHIHILIGMKPTCNLSDLVREIKKASNEFIRQNRFSGNFHWQDGFGAFSCGHRNLDDVVDYVLTQKQHHLQVDYSTEYIQLLKDNEIDFDEKYVFHSRQ